LKCRLLMNQPNVRSYSKSVIRDEWWIHLILFGFGAVTALYTLSYSQAEDIGIFLSEASLISQGSRIYQDIFEIKDPLFLWTAGLSFRIFGRSGPYLMDTLFVAISANVGYWVARCFTLKRESSLVASAIFLGALSGAYFDSFRSTTIAIVLIPIAYACAVNRKWVLSGIICVIIVGFKMSFAPTLVGLLFIILWEKERLKNFSHFVIGAISCSATIIIALSVRGELSGYLEMLRLNFVYRETYPEIVGLQLGIRGYWNRLYTYGSSPILLMTVPLALLLLSVTLRVFKTDRTKIFSMLGLQGGVLAVFFRVSCGYIICSY